MCIYNNVLCCNTHIYIYIFCCNRQDKNNYERQKTYMFKKHFFIYNIFDTTCIIKCLYIYIFIYLFIHSISSMVPAYWSLRIFTSVVKPRIWWSWLSAAWMARRNQIRWSLSSRGGVVEHRFWWPIFSPIFLFLGGEKMVGDDKLCWDPGVNVIFSYMLP